MTRQPDSTSKRMPTNLKVIVILVSMVICVYELETAFYNTRKYSYNTKSEIKPIILKPNIQPTQSISRHVTSNVTDPQFVGFTETDTIWYNIPIANMVTITNENNLNDDGNIFYEYDNTTDFNKCKLNHQLLLWVAHHKTGSVALYSMRKMIVEYCHSSKDNLRKFVKRPESGFWIWRWYCSRDRLIKTIRTLIYHKRLSLSLSSSHSKKIKIHYLNLMRDPVSSILSGFNYHSKDPPDVAIDADPWLDDTLINSDRFRCIFDNIESIKQYANVLQLDINNILIANGYNMTVSQFFVHMGHLSKNIDIDEKQENDLSDIYLKFGLFIEHQRWLCDEWQELFDSFNLVNEIKQFQKGDDVNIGIDNELNSYLELFETGINIKFEYFWHFPTIDIDYNNENVDTKTNGLFSDADQVTIINENWKKISNFDDSVLKLLHLIPSIDSQDYTNIVKRLKQLDINAMTDQKIARNDHITMTKVNRMRQVRCLLENTNTCLDLKEKSIKLDYLWMYPQFC